MAPLGGIGELYLACAALGSLFIVFSCLAGQMHGAGHHGIGGHGGHLGGSHDLGGHAGHIGGAAHGPAAHAPGGHITSDPHGVSAAHGAGAHGHVDAGAHTAAGGAHGSAPHGGAGDQGQPGGPSLQGQLAQGLSHGGQYHFPDATGAHPAVPAHHGGDSGPVATATGVIPRPLRIFITIFSPMTFAMFSACFGISGFLLLSHFPFLGALTAIPAALIAFVITRFTLRLMGLVIRKLEGRSVHGTDQFIGHMATVTVGMGPSGTGQIIYTVDGVRSKSPARALGAGAAFKKGDRVMIAEIRGQVAYVEPWTDSFLPEDGGIISVTEKEKVDRQE